MIHSVSSGLMRKIAEPSSRFHVKVRSDILPTLATMLVGSFFLLVMSTAEAAIALEDFVQNSITDKKIPYVLVKGATWCNPCNELEKYTKTKSLDQYPYYKSAKKLFYKEDVSRKEMWKLFLEKYNLPDVSAYPVVYIFVAGRLTT